MYTLKEAAQYLGRSEWSMRGLLYSGAISFVRLPGQRKYYFDISDLDDLVEKFKFCHQEGLG